MSNHLLYGPIQRELQTWEISEAADWKAPAETGRVMGTQRERFARELWIEIEPDAEGVSRRGLTSRDGLLSNFPGRRYPNMWQPSLTVILESKSSVEIGCGSREGEEGI